MTEYLDVIIVNWNAGHQLADVVSSITVHHEGLVHSVIVVDNASTDGSLSTVEGGSAAARPFKLRIIRNEQNLGFGAACNRGASIATAPFLLFLNPDAEIQEGSLTKALEFMRSPAHPNVGIVGVQLVDRIGRIARSCARFPTPWMLALQATGLDRLRAFSFLNTHMADWDHGSTRQVDHVIGAFYLIRRDIFETVGGFDERFFVYLEDLDLSLRVSRVGYRSMYLASARAFHAGGGTSQQVKAHRLFYSIRSRLLYGFKHFPGWRAWVLAVVTLGLEPLTRSAFCLAKGDGQGVANTWRGFRMLYRDLPRIFERARQP